MASHRQIVRAVLDLDGTTYAEQADIRLDDRPSPLYRLLVLSVLLSARINASVAVAAAVELAKAGYRTPRAMARATWQQRVDALGRGHYRRYDERTATMLGDGAELLQQEYGGDLRRLRERAKDTRGVEEALQRFPGVGPTGAAIFCREVQAVWPDLAPYVDDRAADGAVRLGLPRSAKTLAGLVDREGLPRLLAGCVHATTDKSFVDQVREAA